MKVRTALVKITAVSHFQPLKSLSEFFLTEKSFRRIFALLITLMVLTSLSRTVADLDLWGYLAFGRLFWQSGRFPYQDVFAYVPTRSLWVYHEWLTGVLFYPLYLAFGPAGLQLLKFGLAAATVLLVYFTARRRGAGFWSAALGLLALPPFLAFGYSPVRAQVFTYFFFALSLSVLESARLSGRFRGLILLVLIQLPWANLHGGFLAGLGLLALYALGEASCRRPYWPYVAALGGAGLVTLINPYGLDYWIYLIRAISMPRPEITEWASVATAWQKGIFRMTILMFTTLGLFTLLLAWAARWREVTPGLILLVTLILGLKHCRHQVFFSLAAGAYLPVLLEAYVQKRWGSGGIPLPPGGGRQFVWVALALVWLAGLGWNIARKNPLSLELPEIPADPKVPLSYPLAAVDYIRQHQIAGKILNEFNWGEFLIWSLHPSCRVAMDGRYETVYSDEIFQLYVDFIEGRPGWRKFLDQFPPDLILISPRAKVYPLLRADPHWRQVLGHDEAALFQPQPFASGAQ
ncbi:MAG: hypothetical protein ACUVXF_02385 [Desulfobaccales bacterium]